MTFEAGLSCAAIVFVRCERRECVLQKVKVCISLSGRVRKVQCFFDGFNNKSKLSTKKGSLSR